MILHLWVCLSERIRVAVSVWAWVYGRECAYGHGRGVVSVFMCVCVRFCGLCLFACCYLVRCDVTLLLDGYRYLKPNTQIVLSQDKYHLASLARRPQAAGPCGAHRADFAARVCGVALGCASCVM